MILLRYSPELGQLVDAEGKGIGVVCVPVRATDAMLEASDREHSFGMQWRCALAAARPDLSAATVKVPPVIAPDQRSAGGASAAPHGSEGKK